MYVCMFMSKKSASAALPKGEDDSAEVVVTPKKGEDGSATSQDTPEPLSPVFVVRVFHHDILCSGLMCFCLRFSFIQK